MKNSGIRNTVEALLAGADIQVGGSRAWDIVVKDSRWFARILSGGSLALGESYLDEWWDCPALDQFFYRVLTADLDEKVRDMKVVFRAFLKAKLLNLQNRARSFHVGKHHYDIGNTLFRNMLGRRMVYSCAYWNDADDLDSAQEKKLDLICRKMGLKTGMRILDIGCGWGSFLQYAAENYGVTAVGITVSAEQVKLGQEMCAGLPVEIRLQDYRSLDETFDHVVSVGMFEHVGYKNYHTFMGTVKKCLKPGGLFLLHTIGNTVSRTSTDPWIGKYIFPNSLLPSAQQIARAAEGMFLLEDWHSFGSYYDRTLMAWYQNFIDSWDSIKGGYDRRFFRMWSYYLLSCAGSFRARKNQLWQIVFSPDGVPGGYNSVR